MDYPGQYGYKKGARHIGIVNKAIKSPLSSYRFFKECFYNRLTLPNHKNTIKLFKSIK